MKCVLLNYFDVWGNKEDGYEVNDQMNLGEIDIPDAATDKEICEILKEKQYLTTSDMRTLAVEEYGTTIEILERKSQKPLFGLHIID